MPIDVWLPDPLIIRGSIFLVRYSSFFGIEITHKFPSKGPGEIYLQKTANFPIQGTSNEVHHEPSCESLMKTRNAVPTFGSLATSTNPFNDSAWDLIKYKPNPLPSK